MQQPLDKCTHPFFLAAKRKSTLSCSPFEAFCVLIRKKKTDLPTRKAAMKSAGRKMLGL